MSEFYSKWIHYPCCLTSEECRDLGSLPSVLLLASFSSAVPNLFGTRYQFRGRQFFHGPGRWGGCGGDGWGINGVMGSSRWSFACLPAAHLLLCGLVPKGSPGVGDPCFSLHRICIKHLPHLCPSKGPQLTNPGLSYCKWRIKTVNVQPVPLISLCFVHEQGNNHRRSWKVYSATSWFSTFHCLTRGMLRNRAESRNCG